MTDANDRWTAEQRSHFEKWAEVYAGLYGQDTPFHDAMTARLLALAGVRPGLRVLDLGCGCGRTTIPLLRAGCRVTGWDLSRSILRLLDAQVRELGLGERFQPVCAAAEDLRARERFDLVVGRGLLHHLAAPEAVLDQSRRALVPGGRAAFLDPNPLQPAWIGFVTLQPTVTWAQERLYLRHTPWYDRRLFATAGFASVRLHSLGLVPPPLWGRVPGVDTLETMLAAAPVLRELSLYRLVVARRPSWTIARECS